MSTKANREKLEEKKRTQAINSSIRLFTIGLIVASVVWLIFVIVIVVLDSNRKALELEVEKLELQDKRADALLKGLTKEFVAIESTLRELEFNFTNEKEKCQKGNVEHLPIYDFIREGTYAYNNAKRLLYTGSWQSCQKECEELESCIVFSYVTLSAKRKLQEECHLKATFDKVANTTGVISGPKRCRSRALLYLFMDIFDEMTKFISDLRIQILNETTFINDYNKRIEENKYRYTISAPIPPGETCPDPAVYYGTYVKRRVKCPLDWVCCSRACNAFPTCTHWRHRTSTGSCELLGSYTRKRIRSGYMSGSRACGADKHYSIPSWFPEYQATYKGMYCHNENCTFTTETKMNTPTVRNCAEGCFYASDPVSQFTYNIKTEKCFCKVEKANVVKYNNYTDPTKFHLLFNFA